MNMIMHGMGTAASSRAWVEYRSRKAIPISPGDITRVLELPFAGRETDPTHLVSSPVQAPKRRSR